MPTPTLAIVAAALAPQAATVDDYDFNFLNMGTDHAVLATGPTLFGSITGSPNFAGPGDTIRTCYGIDSFQGGRNESTGTIEITHLSWLQGASLVSQNGIDIGLSSVHAQSVDSLEGDACLSSLFSQGVDSQSGNPITLQAVFGGAILIPPGSFLGLGSPGGVSLLVFADLFDINGVGIELPTVLGTDGQGFPLLPHVLFEVQGPANEGYLNNQYFIASTTESIGLGSAGFGTGGVTNGNGRMGQAVFGATADLSGAVSHNRLTAFTPSTGLIGTTTVSFSGPDRDFWSGYALASRTPMTWAVNGRGAGGGGPDWRVSSAPVSKVDLRALDVRAGGEGDTLFATTNGTSPLGSAIDEPSLIFNAPAFLWSTKAAALMLQEPLSWDTSTGQAIPGSATFGKLPTKRAGLQRLPIHSDPLTGAFLQVSSLSFGRAFRPVLSFAEGSPAIFQFGQGLDIGGESRLPKSLPAVAAPKPSLAGQRLGIAAVGLQFDLADLILVATEVASPVTVVLQ